MDLPPSRSRAASRVAAAAEDHRLQIVRHRGKIVAEHAETAADGGMPLQLERSIAAIDRLDSESVLHQERRAGEGHDAVRTSGGRSSMKAFAASCAAAMRGARALPMLERRRSRADGACSSAGAGTRRAGDGKVIAVMRAGKKRRDVAPQSVTRRARL